MVNGVPAAYFCRNVRRVTRFGDCACGPLYTACSGWIDAKLRLRWACRCCFVGALSSLPDEDAIREELSLLCRKTDARQSWPASSRGCSRASQQNKLGLWPGQRQAPPRLCQKSLSSTVLNPTFRSAFCHNAFITRPLSWIPASLLCRRGSRQPGPAADVKLPKGGTKARGGPAATGPACTAFHGRRASSSSIQTGQTQVPGACAGSLARCCLRTGRAPGAARPAQRPPGRRHARPPPHPRRRPRAPPAPAVEVRRASAMAGGGSQAGGPETRS